jgi:glycine cleavage system H protein
METQQRLGPVSYFRGPQSGRRYAPQEAALSLESEKCVRQLSLPAAGTVLETNSDLERDPSAINHDPYGRGWICRVRPTRPRTLEGATEHPPRTVR